MEAQCPHCEKPIELLEPKDLDAAGLTPNIRGPAIEKGELVPWVRLRNDKFFLFLKEEVDRFKATRREREFDRILKRAGLENSSPEEQLAQIRQQMEEMQRIAERIEKEARSKR